LARWQIDALEKITGSLRSDNEGRWLTCAITGAVEEIPDNPHATKLVFKDASERIVWGSRDDVVARLSENVHVRPLLLLSELGISKDPSWTAKEWLFAAYGVVASALAAYGGANLTAVIFGPPMRSDPIAFTVMVVVFVATLLLTFTGVEHVKGERFKAWMKEWEERHRQSMTPRPGSARDLNP
jgi:hypothetical protein